MIGGIVKIRKKKEKTNGDRDIASRAPSRLAVAVPIPAAAVLAGAALAAAGNAGAGVVVCRALSSFPLNSLYLAISRYRKWNKMKNVPRGFKSMHLDPNALIPATVLAAAALAATGDAYIPSFGPFQFLDAGILEDSGGGHKVIYFKQTNYHRKKNIT